MKHSSDINARWGAIRAVSTILILAGLVLVGCQSPATFIAKRMGSDSIGTNKPENSRPSAEHDIESLPVERKTFTAGNRSPYEVWGETYHVLPSSLGYVEIGIASWYGKKFHGRDTSNREVFDMYKLSAAHKALPLPTWVRVTNLDNGKKVVLRVNDRGPFHSDRLIDLSWKTALKLGFADKGTAPVVVEALDHENYPELVKERVVRDQFYLQLGAFSQSSGAVSLQEKINDMLVFHQLNIGTRILQSELEAAILHKVWLGPIGDESTRDRIAMLVEQGDLGRPLKVDIEGEDAISVSGGN